MLISKIIVVLSAATFIFSGSMAGAADKTVPIKKTVPVVIKKLPVKTPVKKVTPKKTVPKVENLKNGSRFERQKVVTANGAFTADIATLDAAVSGFSVISDTGSVSDCPDGCVARPLKEYVQKFRGFAGIHGAYFCPPDYANCKNVPYQFGAPFYNSSAKQLLNASKVPYGQSSLLVFDKNNKATFFVNGRGFGSVAEFERQNNTIVSAVVGNYPALVNQGQNIVSKQAMDEKQKTTKGDRGGIGVLGSKIFLVVAHSATVPDLAAVFAALGVTDALNLDGGGSTALYFNGAYKVGPGRLLPSAVIFKQQF